MRRLWALLCALLLLPVAPVAAEAHPLLTAEGFLQQGAPAPYIYRSREEGRWRYIDATLRIEITRHASEDPKLVWFESDIRCQGDTRFFSLVSGGEKPGRALRSPLDWPRESRVVFAISDDFFGIRARNRTPAGVVVRNGQIIADEPLPADTMKFPPLDVLAIYPDGRMRTYAPDAYTAQEYLDMGATDTLAFGPILVQNGAWGERLWNEKYSPYREPRCALGMISPGHYVVITAQGRSDESRGARLRWLADRMLALGAVEAINLDGGNTTALYFLGELLNRPANVSRKNLRSITSMLAIGRMDGEIE